MAGTRLRSTRQTTRTGSSTRTSTRPCCSSTVRKFIVGYEMHAETQRNFIPEDAAAQLRVAILKDVSPEVGG